MRQNQPRPIFLGIGPPKTATSWMHKSLRQHPQANLPPMKEIGYWWAKSFLPQRHYFSRFFDPHWFYRESRSYWRDSCRQHFQSLKAGHLDMSKLGWDVHYFWGFHTESWYRNLFKPHLVSGDITPKYCELEAEAIAQIKRRYPDLKIIISVRDPVERAWSRAKYKLGLQRNRQIQDIPEAEWFTYFDNPLQTLASDYQALYTRWSQFFAPEQLHLIFYDQVQDDAWTVFNRLCEFLELSLLPEAAKKQIVRPANVGLSGKIPTQYEAYLFKKHQAAMCRFAEAFPDYFYPKNWLELHEESLKSS
ncbi:MAG: sulfotransferase [Spirulina sp. SIO3F2]|nr:sulfotransferase [Spirulina sp. SIO3F2]